MKKFSEYLIDKENDIRKYVEYFADLEGLSIQEASRRSLARAYSLVSNSDKPMAILTSFRNERGLKQNRALNKELERDMRALGWGFIPVLGGTNEKVIDPVTGKETGETKVIDGEESYFAVGHGDKETFKAQLLGLINKYNQEGAVLNYGDNNAFLLNRKGMLSPLGKWNSNSLAEYWTRLKYGDKKFTFESFNFIAAGDADRTTKLIISKTFA